MLCPLDVPRTPSLNDQGNTYAIVAVFMQNTKNPHNKKIVAAIIALVIVGIIIAIPITYLSGVNNSCGEGWQLRVATNIIKVHPESISNFQTTKIFDSHDVTVATVNDVSTGDCTTASRNVLLTKTFSISENAGSVIQSVDRNLTNQGFSTSPIAAWHYFYSHECNASVARQSYKKGNELINIEVNDSTQHCNNSGYDMKDAITALAYNGLTAHTVYATTTILPQ